MFIKATEAISLERTVESCALPYTLVPVHTFPVYFMNFVGIMSRYAEL